LDPEHAGVDHAFAAAVVVGEVVVVVVAEAVAVVESDA